MVDRPRVVVLGAGFAGLAAARALAKAPVDVTMYDRNNYHTFQPLLYAVATSVAQASVVGHPVRDLFHDQRNFNFHQATVTGIDFARRQIQFEQIAGVSYDYLILGLGSRVNFYGVPGASEHAFPLYTLTDALRLREHILKQFEAVDRDPALIDDGALHFVVVGGGSTGVETSGAMAELFHGVLAKDYPNLPVDTAHISLIEGGNAILSMFPEDLSTYAKKALEERGVEVRLGEVATAIEGSRVKLKSGEEIKAHTLVWGAGLQAIPAVQSLGVPLAKAGRLSANADLSLANHPEVFAVGDCALITDAKTGKQLPQLGSVAMQAGALAGKNITNLIQGKPAKPFKYLDKGTMATIGRGAAVVEMPVGPHLKGGAASVAWVGVHLALLSGGKSQVAAAAQAGWTALTHDRPERVIYDSPPEE